MNTKTRFVVNYHFMVILALIVGVIGIAFQFIPGSEPFSFMLTVAVLGGLMSGSNRYEERERLQLERSYKTAFEWLLLAVLAAYAYTAFSRWFVFIDGAVVFLNSHWPGLILSMMCIVMGMAGFQKARPADSAYRSSHK